MSDSTVSNLYFDEYLHCSAYSYADIDDMVLSLNKHIMLCGIPRYNTETGQYAHWTWPGDFMETNLDARPRCPKCEGHPDLPLLVLSDIDQEYEVFEDDSTEVKMP